MSSRKEKEDLLYYYNMYNKLVQQKYFYYKPGYFCGRCGKPFSKCSSN